jgi:NTP pyrophosphatase (non-canonical NTP hydrolase)
MELVVVNCAGDKNLKERIMELIKKIEQWGRNRGLDRAHSGMQFIKLGEEFGELAEALLKKDKDGIVDAIGDMTVMLVMLSMTLEDYIGKDFTKCVQSAYDEIKDRKGKIENGIFIKED